MCLVLFLIALIVEKFENVTNEAIQL